MSKARVLVVEDEFITGADLQAKLQEMGYDVPVVADTGEYAVQVAEEQMPDLVLMDIHLKDKMTGIEAAEIIHSKFGTPVIFLTGQSDEATVEKAKVSAPFGYLIKPVDDRALKISINMALYKNAIDENVKRQEAIIRALLNATTDAFFIIDNQGMLLGLNEALAKKAGKAVADLLNTTFYELIPENVISTPLAEEIRAGLGGKPGRLEEEFNGRWYDTNIFPIPDKNGAVAMVAVFCNDITVRKNAENEVKLVNQKLEKEKEQLLIYSSALNTMDDIVIITDAMGNMEYVNSAFSRKLGFSRDDIQRRHISDIQNPGDPYALDKNAFFSKSKDAWSGNLTVKNKYNLKIRTSLRSTPVIMDNRLICRVFVLREQL